MTAVHRCTLGAALFLIIGSLTPTAHGWDLDYLFEPGGSAITWTSAVGYEYRLVTGDALAEMTGSVRRIITANDDSTAYPMPGKSEVQFFRGADLGWAFKILEISNMPNEHVTLRWSTHTGTPTYAVFRAPTPLDQYTTINAQPIPGTLPATIWTDTTATADSYCYQVGKIIPGGVELAKNAAGFHRIDIDYGYQLLCNPYETLDGQPLTFDNVLGDQCPTGTACYFYRLQCDEGSGPATNYLDDYGSNYVMETFTTNGWYPCIQEASLGKGFWLTTLVATQVCFRGELPDAITAPTATLSVLSNPTNTEFTILGYPYPLDMPWSNVSFLAEAVPGDSIYRWDTGEWNYIGYSCTASGWLPDITTQTLRACEAFAFLQRSPTNRETGVALTEWVEPKPYTWP